MNVVARAVIAALGGYGVARVSRAIRAEHRAQRRLRARRQGPGVGAGQGGDPARLAAAERRPAASPGSPGLAKHVIALRPPKGIRITVEHATDGILHHRDHLIVLSPGQWRLIDERTLEKVTTLANGNRLAIDRESLDASDRLN